MRRKYGAVSLFARRFTTLIELQVFRASRSSPGQHRGQLEANAVADIILSQDEQEVLAAAASGFVNRRARGCVAVNN
jgi:hypothetical protein